MSEEHSAAVQEQSACPFCASSSGCEHLLLLLDMTFRTAEGGVLINAFKDRWAKNFELDDDKFDEPEAFDHLLDEVGSLADASVEYAVEGGPGMTSEYEAYFCSSSERMITAVRKFENETNR